MSYTLLRIDAGGVFLLDYHLRRLGLEAAGPQRAAFLRAARQAAPGSWAVSRGEGDCRWEARGPSRLAEGLPAELAVSPVLDRRGAFAKEGPAGPYAALRAAGRVRLLTSADGSEIYEACSAAVLAFEGGRLICAPADRPRVWSTAEAALRERLAIREAPIPAGSRALLLVNAQVGSCAPGDGYSRDFPAAQRRRIEEIFEGLIKAPRE